MLKKLTIRNFKAIEDMTIEFTPLTVLIGENGCGKSTILQAIDFLRSAASRDIPEYLREKGWKIEELKSQLNNGNTKPLEFISTWNFLVKDSPETLEWTLSIDHEKSWILREKLIRCSDNKLILSYHNDDQKNIPASLEHLTIQSSALKYKAGTSIDTDEIDALFFFLSDSTNFELLSPEKLRSGNKLPYAQNIGAGGEALAYCIDKMSDAEKKEVNNTVSDLIGSCVEIQTIDRGNKVELSVIYKAAEKSMIIDSKFVSDGLLRIIAFATIAMEIRVLATDDESLMVAEPGEKYIVCNNINGMILLDEIENGINVYLIEQIISLLRKRIKETTRQIILTTHSPVILNEFDPKEIVFLWKDDNNSVHSKNLFDTEEMREALSFLNPGEIWENYGKDTILHKLGANPEVK